MEKRERRESRIIRALLLMAFAMVLSAFPGFGSEAAVDPSIAEEAHLKGWVKDTDGIHYYGKDYKTVTGWKKISKKWYYFNGKGVMQTGWVKESGKWYYLGATGVMKSNQWLKWKNNKYYLAKDGHMAIGGKTIGKNKYYFHTDGSLASSEYIKGIWVSKNGTYNAKKAKASWKKDKSGKWYGDSTGWFARSRWLWIDQACYYFNAKGYVVTGKTVKGYKVDKTGARLKKGVKVKKAGEKKTSASVKKKTGVLGMEQRLAKLGCSNAEAYTYEITPMLAPFNDWFFIKTWNPDPDSFCFTDKTTKYSESGGQIAVSSTKYEDVKYENEKTLRVKGGYIAYGSGTDGGALVLVKRTVTGSYPVYNLSTGAVTYYKDYSTEETKTKVKVQKVKDDVDYLIDTYAKGKKGFFNKLDAVQAGLDSICLYSGVYVLGDLYKSKESPYYGISSSPHIDQRYYIQQPYGRKDSKSMLMSALYPYRLDSLGFPGEMTAVAKRLNSKATSVQNGSAHWLVDITCNGKTRSYGGAGTGGGQGIYKNQILYKFTFTKSAKDASTKITLTDVAARLKEYGALKVDEDKGKNMKKLTWAQIRKQVGKGSYVRIQIIGSVFGGSTTGYTYLYDDGSTWEGVSYIGSVGYMYNTWFEGRYYNKYEYYYPGATLEQTIEDVQPSLTFKNAVIKLPDDGRQYYCYMRKAEDGSWSYKERTVEEYGYDPKTGKWPGYTTFTYNSESKSWTAEGFDPENSYNSIYYKEDGKIVKLDTEEFLDSITITMDEAKAMKIDRNTNKDPSSFLIYDRKSKPGTKGTN